MPTYSYHDFTINPTSAEVHSKTAIQSLCSHPIAEQEFISGIYTVLKKHLAFDYILFTFSLPETEEGRFCFHPSPKTIPAGTILRTTREQSFVIGFLDKPCVIHIENQDAHSIVNGVIRQVFLGRAYSVMRLRKVSQTGVICGFSIIRLGNEAFAEKDVRALFALCDPLVAFFDAQKPAQHPVPSPCCTNVDYLPLASLPGMQSIMPLIWSVARQECTVLIMGETGTGKEIVANTLYNASRRIYGSFVKVNCGSIPPTLVDSELFGHEQGAFTGATKTVKGRFEQAHRGCLFLDEIGELPLLAQTRLLRVLQDGLIMRVGASTPIGVDVRLIAATNRVLPEEILKGNFREDLFYRLNVFTIFLPPLRERPQDILALTDFFLQARCRRLQCAVPTVDASTLHAMLAYPWPGNVRELQNTVERALILWIANPTQPFAITVPSRIEAGTALARKECPPARYPAPLESASEAGFASLDMAVKQHIEKALLQANGKISGKNSAAELLQVNPNTLRAKMKKLGLCP